MSRRAIPVVEIRPQARDPLLLELVAAIGAGNIEFGPIHDDEFYVDGLCHDSGRVRINPSHHVVNIVLHECLHRMRPKMKERGVRSRVGKIMRQMSDDEIDRLYNVILSTAAVKNKPESLR